jgi:hypothetical protein
LETFAAEALLDQAAHFADTAAGCFGWIARIGWAVGWHPMHASIAANFENVTIFNRWCFDAAVVRNAHSNAIGKEFVIDRFVAFAKNDSEIFPNR